ncbi:UNKNOWN [Stylonychia lemnae]|uniref:PH domain-containing protein n=1 Tax=Stylonychia lemnae TaxID=5949 RepID=A0A078AHR3_STYLE|nr:UNKNOWN [Stylonychia lemnae]|eukprot:CDW80363.1 UNKNOWN [Stylonychia lemnae]
MQHDRKPLIPLYPDDFSNFKVVFKDTSDDKQYLDLQNEHNQSNLNDSKYINIEQQQDNQIREFNVDKSLILSRQKEVAEKRSRQSRLEQSYKRSVQKMNSNSKNKENLSPTSISSIKLCLFKNNKLFSSVEPNDYSVNSMKTQSHVNAQTTASTQSNVSIKIQPKSGSLTDRTLGSSNQQMKNENTSMFNSQNSIQISQIQFNNSKTSRSEVYSKRNISNQNNNSNHHQKVQSILKPSPLDQLQICIKQPMPNSILMEGSILKYKPGMNYQYRIKYLVLQKEMIQIFKSRWQAKLPHQESNINTIVKIPLSIIKSCQKVKVDIAKNTRQSKTNQQWNKCYQFEVFLKDEYQDELVHMELNQMRPQSQLCMNNPQRDSHLNQSSQIISPRNNLDLTRRSVLEGSQLSISTHFNQVGKPSNIEGKPHSRSTSNISFLQNHGGATAGFQHFRQRSSIISSAANLEDLRNSLEQADKSKLEEIVEQNLQEPQFTYSIMVKNPSAWIKGLASQQTWTHREIEWYSGQRRLLFACEEEDECNQWVVTINMALNHFKMEKKDIKTATITAYQNKNVNLFR